MKLKKKKSRKLTYGGSWWRSLVVALRLRTGEQLGQWFFFLSLCFLYFFFSLLIFSHFSVSFLTCCWWWLELAMLRTTDGDVAVVLLVNKALSSSVLLSKNPLLFNLFCLVFISRRRGSHPALSCLGDRVEWLGQPLCNHPRAAHRAWLPCPFHDGGRPCSVGYVSFLAIREGEKEREKHEKKILKNSLSFPYCTSKGRRIVSFKTTSFYDSVSFFFCEKRNEFGE